MKELKKASIITMEGESSQKDHRSPRTYEQLIGEGVYREGEDFGAVGATRASRTSSPGS